MDIEEQVTAEVERLHRFFTEWFTGRLPDSDEAFAAVSDALEESFLLVSPRGDTDEREPLLEMLRASHGRAALDIWIENVDVRHTTEDIVLATYEEWQRPPGAEEPTSRLSTALFRRDGARLRWLHVHETWLPDARPGSD